MAEDRIQGWLAAPGKLRPGKVHLILNTFLTLVNGVMWGTSTKQEWVGKANVCGVDEDEILACKEQKKNTKDLT